MIYNSLMALIGKTPILQLNNFCKNEDLAAKIYAKLEYFNPVGSSKDRIASEIVNAAINNGKINADTTIIEATSGNTGIALAAIAASKGLKCIIVMPETMSIERQKLMKAYGAELVLTDGKLGMRVAVLKANELSAQIKNSFMPKQFENPDNPIAHYKTTGPEIYTDMAGSIDIFVCCVGTGGTISGTGKYLKEKKNDIKIVAVEPSASPLLTKGVAGPHKIQGIGANFVPATLDTKIYDEVISVTDSDAYLYSKKLAISEGILTGVSSGAALCAAAKLAARPENFEKRIVVILPDTGERYLSTEDFI